jgi:hypothetical protein
MAGELAKRPPLEGVLFLGNFQKPTIPVYSHNFHKTVIAGWVYRYIPWNH